MTDSPVNTQHPRYRFPESTLESVLQKLQWGARQTSFSTDITPGDCKLLLAIIVPTSQPVESEALIERATEPPIPSYEKLQRRIVELSDDIQQNDHFVYVAELEELFDLATAAIREARDFEAARQSQQ